MIRKVRLTAALALICAVFLPLSECSHGRDHPQVAPPKSLGQRVHPQDTHDFSYQYGYRSLKLNLGGLCTILGFGWPLAFVLFVRGNSGIKIRWLFRILELLLCAGTIYWLNVISFHAHGATWLYGAYVSVIAVSVFTLAGIVSWFRDAHRPEPAIERMGHRMGFD